ncbi:MAG: ATP-binding protein [Cyanobacteria bacterium J06635_1]
MKSAEYLAWRRRFFHQRLGVGLWIGLVYVSILFIYWLYLFMFQIEKLRSDFDRIFSKPWLADHFRAITVIACFVVLGLILTCLLIHKTQWGRRHPAVIFFIFTSAVNGFATLLIATFYGIPIKPNPSAFLAFAVLIPICWRLHLSSQLLPIIYYTVALPILGMTDLGDESILNVYNLGDLIEMIWVCLICNLGVFVYERLRLSEFESRRELRIFLHAISHDLRNPVMGTALVIKNALKKATGPQAQISTAVMQRLLQSSDRQLTLINTLVEAYHTDIQGITLDCQPLQINAVIEAVLADIGPKLSPHQVTVSKRIRPDLPLVNADEMQLWRVLSNLIDNALKHNPPDIHLILAATVINFDRDSPLKTELTDLFRDTPLKLTRQDLKLKPEPRLLCCLHDDGVGIPPAQSERLFELYTRGNRARYMPGLGLGLYLCKEIIAAHGGEIGVISQPAVGSLFWFTLPLATSPVIRQL